MAACGMGVRGRMPSVQLGLCDASGQEVVVVVRCFARWKVPEEVPEHKRLVRERVALDRDCAAKAVPIKRIKSRCKAFP